MTLREISDKTWKEYHSIPDDEPEEAPSGTRKPIATIPDRSPARERFYQDHFERTTIVPPIEFAGGDERVVLRRFMDLPKFIDMIANKRLLLAPVRRLQEGDPHECEAIPDYSKVPREGLKQQILSLAEEFVTEHEFGYWLPVKFDLLSHFAPTRVTKKAVEEIFDRMSDDEMRKAAWCIEHRRLQDEICCNCWYDSELESDAMWRLYCDRVGVAITTSVKALRNSVTCEVPRKFKDHFKLTLAKITYDNASIVSDVPPWLIKKLAFRHEHEVRLFVDYPSAQKEGFVLTVDPSILIEEMTVSPYATRWQANAIKAMSQKILGNQLRIKPSKHRDSPKPSWPLPQASA